ncbi:MAG: T9SS type A sorting domain-containing protein [Bacteroidetes bacterium]|nr:T9SS type A sorting domain-containing protein [Bacteroidota bacterium]MBK8364410.1 T9SS type A sorting domain-containing protein [Bacteroidota bacterium]MBK9415384.1 T9SS type A sorting domain-containing protein [Bacteroidota bacterium]MBP6426570.1 T9SS type A sorting domain-containing protein [Bacteroidia bacterium]
MKSIILLLFLLLLAQLSWCQSTFQKTYNHSVPGVLVQDHIYSILLDSSENIVLSGNTKDFIQQTSSAAVLKTNTDGNLLWFKLYAYTPTNNDATASLLLPDNNYVVAGTLSDSSWGDNSSFIFRTDSNGNLVWSKIYSFNLPTIYLYSLSNYNGSIYTGGTLNNTQTGTFQDFFFTKLDYNGHVVWSKYLYDTLDNEFHDFSITSDGGIAFSGDRLIDNFPANTDIYFGKLDSTGQLLWSKQILLPGFEGNRSRIRETIDGGYMVFTYTQSVGLGSSDFLFLKTDSIGNVVWSKLIGTINSEVPATINQLPNGSFSVTGLVGTSNSDVAVGFNIDLSGNVSSVSTYGLTNGTRFGVSAVLNNYIVNAGDHSPSYQSMEGDFYIVKTDLTGYSGCFETPYLFSDSSFTLSISEVDDSVIEMVAPLTDVSMIMYDATSSITETTLCMTAVDNNGDLESQVKIFPNPNYGKFNLVRENYFNTVCRIYNVFGELVLEEAVIGNSNSFDVDLPSGIYFLSLENGIELLPVSKKFIIL